MSTHRVDVVRISELLPHPNADRLEMCKVGGYTCLVPKGTYKVGDCAAYVEPDYIVPDTEQFAFLAGKRRIGAKRLRGVWSEGLLVAAPAGAQPGDDVMEKMGITRYEPPVRWGPGGQNAGFHGPPGGLAEGVPEPLKHLPKYDLENLKKYNQVFMPGEGVYVTEKLHGCNARYVYLDGRMWCGGRTQWRKQEPANVYWECLKQNPWIETWCREFEGNVLYGEAFGAVQDLTYGAAPGQVMFRAFDVMTPTGKMLDSYTFIAVLEAAQRVPILRASMPFDMDDLQAMAEEPSLIGGGLREGLVVKPEQEQTHPLIGRVALKLVSNAYLSR